MITADKIGPDILHYGIAVVLLFIILGMYGRQTIEWILMKLYELFIKRNPMKL
jgi:hypothetical protein